MSENISFTEEINQNKNLAEVSAEAAAIETMSSSLKIRLRGGYITECELTNPEDGNRIGVLYSEPELEKPKLTASHVMSPAGPYDGLGGQHGFPRWADYHEFPMPDGSNGEKRVAIQAKRSDDGLSLTKAFELHESALTMHTTVRSCEDAIERTSIGEHLYFSLLDEQLDGLKVNGQSLDELLGDGSEDVIRNAGTLFWAFGGEAKLDFPAGHSVKLYAEFEGRVAYPLAMWIWKRPGSPSICFEPVAGVEHLDDGDTMGVEVQPYGSATLSTTIELL